MIAPHRLPLDPLPVAACASPEALRAVPAIAARLASTTPATPVEIGALIDLQMEHERCELAAWRVAGRDVLALVERVLAAQGDGAEPDLVKLQHALAELMEFSNPTAGHP